MADTYLTEGATSFVAGSWADGIGFAVGADLNIDRMTAQTVDAGLDQSAVAQIDYLKIGRGFSGTIGTLSTPLKCGASAAALNAMGIFNDAAGGTLYLHAANIAGAGVANTIAYYAHSGMGRAYLVGGAFTTIDVGSGYVEVGQSATSPTVNVGGGEMFIDSGTAATTLNIFGGKVRTKRQFATINNYGGALVYDISATITTGLCGSTARWDHRGGNITTMTIAGAFTVENLNRTCTVGVTALTTWPKANINRTTPSTVSATFSNETKVAGGPATGYSAGGGIGA